MGDDDTKLTRSFTSGKSLILSESSPPSLSFSLLISANAFACCRFCSTLALRLEAGVLFWGETCASMLLRFLPRLEDGGSGLEAKSSRHNRTSSRGAVCGDELVGMLSSVVKSTIESKSSGSRSEPKSRAKGDGATGVFALLVCEDGMAGVAVLCPAVAILLRDGVMSSRVAAGGARREMEGKAGCWCPLLGVSDAIEPVVIDGNGGGGGCCLTARFTSFALAAEFRETSDECWSRELELPNDAGRSDGKRVEPVSAGVGRLAFVACGVPTAVALLLTVVILLQLLSL